MDETGTYYTEWSKSERKTPIQYINTWNLERWLWQPYMGDRKRDTDIKNKLLYSVGEGKCGMVWENSIKTCILPHVKKMTSPSSIHETGHSKPVHCDNTEGWNGEGGGRGFGMVDTCTPVAD